MSQGKYSPRCPHANKGYDFKYNAKREIPPSYTPGVDTHDEEIHFANYDEEGFDSYGYSAYYADGTYAGIGSGIDRLGYTESDYLSMSFGEFMDISHYG